jgi:hypothetical protein
MRPLPEWRSWENIEGVGDDPETGTLAHEMAEDNWNAWRGRVVAEWKGPKLLLSDAHHLLDLLFAKFDVAGPKWWNPPLPSVTDKRFRKKTVGELAELLWFTVATFSSFASPAVAILERLQQLLDEGERVVDAKWYEVMHNLLEALVAEQSRIRDYNDRRNRSRGGTEKAEQERKRLKPMLDAATAVAQERWLANGRGWKRGDKQRIEDETYRRLPDYLKSLAAELTRNRIDAIRSQIEAELPLTETDTAKT